MWKVKLKEIMPLLGHRNWILIVDKAYPLQSAAGMTYLDSESDHARVISKVLDKIDEAKHIKPILYTDLEFDYLSEMGEEEDEMVESMMDAIGDREVNSIPHEEIFAKLDEASKLFNVLVIKTESTVAYTSLFIELDCGYWSAEQEAELRALMGAESVDEEEYEGDEDGSDDDEYEEEYEDEEYDEYDEYDDEYDEDGEYDSPKSYEGDRDFIEQYHSTVELVQGDCRILISPTLQGRVVTSTMGGEDDYSFGWINYDLIASQELLPHCNNFGGEDRFWVGPEGGQFSIFFPQGTQFDFEDWQAPEAIDTAEWDWISQTDSEVVLGIDAQFTNTSGKEMKCRLERTISILSPEEIQEKLGMDLPEGVESVGFQSDNRMTNKGDFAWTKETGMLSIWTLGQFCPSEQNTVLIPYKEVAGEKINDSYFGTIPAERFSSENGMILYKCDGLMRGKIGTPPAMTYPIAMALDVEFGTLTIVKFNFAGADKEYVNSMWEQQSEPFKGDVINSYNDGPLEDGTIMGGFYEIETSSPAAALAPEGSITHISTTIHLKGDVELLEIIAAQLADAAAKA